MEIRYFKHFIVTLFLIPMLLAAQPKTGDKTDKQVPQAERQGPHTGFMPDWSIKEEVQTIEHSLGNYDPLIQSLEEANNDLKVDLATYLQEPGDQVLAARITAKMSHYAKQIVQNVDHITADQDGLIQVFSSLNRKLRKFEGHLKYKAGELSTEVQKHDKSIQEMETMLKELSANYKEEKDPQLKDQYYREFRRVFRNYNLKVRYKEGVSRNQHEYETLGKNLEALVRMFQILQDAFETLIANLEAEKSYLTETIKLQADAIRVQQLVHEGISDGSRAVVEISQKLALLYTQVDAFAKVQEKINRDMTQFTDSTKILGSLVQQIEQAPYQSAPTVDRAIEYFYTAGQEERGGSRPRRPAAKTNEKQ